MTSFAEALRKGIEDHEHARRAREEMDQVLADASRDISEVLGMDVSLLFDIEERPARLASAMEHFVGRAPMKSEPVLVARRSNGRRQVLADVKFGNLGYPTTLRWEDAFYAASDRADFEAGIKELLAHSATGAKIKALVAAA